MIGLIIYFSINAIILILSCIPYSNREKRERILSGMEYAGLPDNLIIGAYFALILLLGLPCVLYSIIKSQDR